MANKKKEKVKEIFEVEKDGEEKIIEKKVVEKKDPTPKKERKKQIEQENKILRNILIVIGVIVVAIIIFVVFVKIVRTVNYKGVKFDMVKEGDLIFYHTSFPITYQGELAEYNIYLRNNPNDLEKKVSASGTLPPLSDLAVLNMEEDFNCDGDGVIAIANLVNLYNALGGQIVKDENASCDSQGRYLYLNIQPGNETSIEMFGPNCYNLNVNNCEILEVTERFISGMLVQINLE